MWTHRPTIIGGRSEPGDREILRKGVPVGRVYHAKNMDEPYNWVWVAGYDRGRATSMGEALEAVRQSVLRREG